MNKDTPNALDAVSERHMCCYSDCTEPVTEPGFCARHEPDQLSDDEYMQASSAHHSKVMASIDADMLALANRIAASTPPDDERGDIAMAIARHLKLGWPSADEAPHQQAAKSAAPAAVAFAQALEALDELTASARGDEPFNHFAAPLIRSFIEASASATQAPAAVGLTLGNIDANDGFWRSCSGCHELNEGHSTGPYSELFKCALGVGCRECGGLGAVWDDTDYNAMAEHMARSLYDPMPAGAAVGPVAWTPGPNVFKDWCSQWFGPDSDDDYLARAVFDLPPMAQKFKATGGPSTPTGGAEA